MYFLFRRFILLFLFTFIFFNSFDKFVNNNQKFLTMKYSKILPACICKFDACRHLPYFRVCATAIQYNHIPYLKITFEYHKIPIEKQHAFFNTRYTFIHSSRWFVILLLYTRPREEKKNLKWYAIFFCIWNFSQTLLFLICLHVCISAIPRFFFFQKNKEQNPFLAWIYFVCSCCEREKDRI